MNIPIAIADDNTVFLEGLCSVINSFPDFKVIIKTNDGQRLLDQIDKSKTKPRICIFDISLPIVNGYNTLKEIKERWPDMKVLILSMISNEFNVLRSIKIGANGFLIKGCKVDDLHDALKMIVDTGAYYANFIDIKDRKTEAREKILLNLSYREMDFLSLCCTELTYKGIAEKMNVSMSTIESYKKTLFEKVNVNSRIGLVLFALNLGILPR